MASFILACSYGHNPVSHYFFSLGRELTRRGHNVIILVDQQRHDAEREGNPRVLTWPSRRPTHWRDALFLHRLVRETRPSVLIANFGSVNVSMVVGFLDRVPRRVAWYHTIIGQVRLDDTSPFWKRWLLERRKAMVYRLATNVVAVSGAALADVRGFYGVPEEKSRALALLLADPFRAGLRRERDRIVCVGRLFPSKGQATLIRALPQIARQTPGVSVDFFGDGPSRSEYVALAASLGVAQRCRFRGWRPLEEVHEALLTAAVAVVASHAEAYGLAAVEAQAMGTPLVATAVDGMKETVVDGETGLLVPPGDHEVLAERIGKLLREEALRERLGRRARDHFLERFSDARIGAHVNYLESLAG